MWIYAQSTGRIFQNIDGATHLLATGYSGTGDGENNPDQQCVHDHGQLPRGLYSIGAPEQFNHMVNCLRLTPDTGNDMCEPPRTGFLIHDGVFFGGPHGATSHGCICLLEAARRTIWDSGDHRLEIVRNDP